MIRIAELILKIKADLQKLKTDLSKLMKEKFQIGVGGKGGGVLGRLGLGKIALISAGVLAIGFGIKKLVKGLAASSPFLKGVFSMFKRATTLFFRPFGDFLANLLKPLAIVLLRAASKWLSFTRGLAKEEGGIIGSLKEKIDEFFTGEFDFGEWLIENIPKFIIGLFDIGEWIGLRIADIVIGLFNIGIWLGERLVDFIFGVFDFGFWLGEKIAAYIKGEFDLGQWLGDNIDPFFGGVFDVGEWLGENFIEFFVIKPFEIGEWIGQHMREFFIGTFDFGKWLLDNITNFFKGFFRPKSRQTGGRIDETGLFKLHKGEEVIPANKVRNNSKTTIFRPTFNFSGSISSELDVDSIMRRASRQTEINLKRFTSI